MTEFVPLNSKARKLFYEKVNTYFGIDKDFKLDGILFKTTKNKYYLVDNKLAEIAEVNYRAKVLGLYIAEINDYGELRLSMDGSQLLGPLATEHLLELNETEKDRFIRGEDLDVSEKIESLNLKNQYYILYFVDDFGRKNYLGCSKIKNEKLLNFIPKGRRVRDGQ